MNTKPLRLTHRFTNTKQFCSNLISIVVHGHQTQEMIHVTTFAQFAHQFRFDAFNVQNAVVSGRRVESLHTDGAVLTHMEWIKLNTRDTRELRVFRCDIYSPHLGAFWPSLCSAGRRLQGFYLKHTHRSPLHLLLSWWTNITHTNTHTHLCVCVSSWSCVWCCWFRAQVSGHSYWRAAGAGWV